MPKMPIRKPSQSESKTVKIPSQVKIAGGVVLKAMPFKIIAYNNDGSPKTFELRSANEPHDMSVDGNCVLFANEEWIRTPHRGRSHDDHDADPIGLHSMVEGNR